MEHYENKGLNSEHGCETWSRTIIEERSLWVLEKKVQRRIFRTKREGEKGELRKGNFIICTLHEMLLK